ncbi:jg23670 [Pararge aegeria aegeria]|uniref:Jg23670 protein n=7 Tax=Pararge aegeria TaxID=116150 RepID=A0A8S4QNN8_9NEOP|nr:jg23670 [Pararge aegeria aegeria]
MYLNLVSPPHPDTEYGRYMTLSHKIYELALDSFPAPDPPEE